MRVYNLACRNGHLFEGWFSSSEDFEAQQSERQIQCPVCEDDRIDKKLHAPAVRRSAASAASRETLSSSAESTAHSLTTIWEDPALPLEAKRAAMRAALAAHIRATTENVGDEFAQQARAMHYYEEPQRNIRGQASADEVSALLDEGIAVLPLPFQVDGGDMH